ncbi:uncharacterized protein LOC101854413 [Aplysia californica]|uniref:Uncharacterized protein LOC101854413 n=1 Tax=Aplysia californica TaxID=6500 RepID=A0ABM0JQ84_APLCA|nr:uncharacterized protein LOC101854413 [Aplysia californica]
MNKTGISVHYYNEGLFERIKESFMNFVEPSSFKLYISKYSKDVLNKFDEGEIDAEIKCRGVYNGAVMLLNKLTKYRGWFECAMNVLRDPDMKLANAAEEMETIKMNYDAELERSGLFLNSTGVQTPSPPVQYPTGEVGSDFSLLSANSSSASFENDADPDVLQGDCPVVPPYGNKEEFNNVTFTLKAPPTDDVPAAEKADGDENQSPRSEPPKRSKKLASDGPKRMSKTQDSAQPESSGDQKRQADPLTEGEARGQGQGNLNVTGDLPAKEVSEVQEKHILSSEAENLEGAVGGADPETADHEYMDITYSTEDLYTDTEPPAKLNKPPVEHAPPVPFHLSKLPAHLTKKVSEDEIEKKLKEVVARDLQRLRIDQHHGSAFDFTLEETEAALRNVRGWHKQIQEKDIWLRLSPFRQESGRYILWFWPRRKRPALCITHNGKVKTYTFHKTPEKGSSSKLVSYYMYKSQHKSKSLKDLVEYHLENGFVDENDKTLEDKTVRLSSPVL